MRPRSSGMSPPSATRSIWTSTIIRYSTSNCCVVASGSVASSAFWGRSRVADRAAHKAAPAVKDGGSLTEQMVDRFLPLRLQDLPAKAKDVAVNDLLDMAGNCLSARQTDYMRALLKSCDGGGTCSAIGHARPLRAADAALMNGTGTHGEDFDDTLEGAPIRVGAMVIPAALAAGEGYGRSG